MRWLLASSTNILYYALFLLLLLLVIFIIVYNCCITTKLIASEGIDFNKTDGSYKFKILITATYLEKIYFQLNVFSDCHELLQKAAKEK